MENNWNDFASPVDAQPVKPAKSSPFADSPYESAYTPPVYQPPAPKPRKKKSRIGLWAVLTLVLVAVCVGVTVVLMNQHWSQQLSNLSEATNNRLAVMQQQLDAALNANAATGTEAPAEEGLTPGQVYAQNMQAVVAITGYISDGYEQYNSFGSGFLFTQDGYVVTNYHVVEGASSLAVTMYDGLEYAAQLIGYDATNDIALLKIEGEEAFPCVKIGSSDALAVGDKVAAIGNPLGELTSTLTVGYVSAKDRIIATDGTSINMLQTDAAINSGNSGGPLFNMQGQVIGITTAKYSGTSTSGASIEGIGFAIPMDDVIGMLENLRDYGYITGAYLGVYVRDVSASSIRDGVPAGALVEEVTPGSCAEAAGIQAKDIVLDLGGYKITNTTDLIRYLRKFDGGDTTTITVWRGGIQLNLTITLDEKPRETTASDSQSQFPMPGDEGFEEWYRDFIERFQGE